MKGLDSLAVLADLLLEVADGGGVLGGLVLGLGNAGLDHVLGLHLVLGGQFLVLGADLLDHAHEVGARGGLDLDLDGVELVTQLADLLQSDTLALVLAFGSSKPKLEAVNQLKKLYAGRLTGLLHNGFQKSYVRVNLLQKFHLLDHGFDLAFKVNAHKGGIVAVLAHLGQVSLEILALSLVKLLDTEFHFYNTTY